MLAGVMPSLRLLAAFGVTTVVATVVATVAAAHPASAQDGAVDAGVVGAAPAPDDAAADERARQHFESGTAYYESGEWQSALDEFQRSYELSQRPELFYNMHLCYFNLGRLDEAVHALERFLEEVSDMPNRGNMERRLENLRRQLEQQQRAGSGAGSGTGTGAGAGAGTGAGTTTDSGADAGATTSAGTATGGGSEGGGGVPVASWIGFIVGGVGLATMGVFGALALSEESSVKSGCGATMACSPDEVSAMDTYALVSDIGLGVGVAGVAVGVIFLLVGRGDDDSSGAVASLRVAPWVARGSAGAAVGGIF